MIFSFFLNLRDGKGWGFDVETDLTPGGGTPYNGLYGEAPPERGTFFRLQVHKRVGISQVSVYERVEKSLFGY